MRKRSIKTKIKMINAELARAVLRHADTNNPLYKVVMYSLFPCGKRIRPLLCVEACEVCGGNIKSAMHAAIAVELIHGFSLIHDDLPCMGDDDYRRGKLSCHKKFGEASAVLAGDAMLAMAFAIIAEIKDEKILSATLRLVARASGIFGMTGGQAYDIKYTKSRKIGEIKSLINSLKTGELFTASILIS